MTASSRASTVRRRLVIALGAVTLLLPGPGSSQSRPGVSLSRVGVSPLKKTSGRVDQVLRLPGGGLLVRDADFYKEKTQALEVYRRDGSYSRKLGSFGQAPGSYFRLKDAAMASDGTLWVADYIGRITRFALDGVVKSTTLVQKPGFQVTSIILDEPRGVYYLAGCLPEKVYLDLGCKLVHQYRLSDRSYLKSFLPTDQEALDKKLLGLEDYFMDVDAQGRVFVVDAPIYKLFRIEPGTGKVSSFPLESQVIRPVGALAPGGWRAAAETSFLIERVVTAGAYVVVSIRKPQDQGYVLHVLNGDGRQLAADLPAPGKLVGETPAGNLLFVTAPPPRSEISEYELVPASTPVPRRKGA